MTRFVDAAQKDGDDGYHVGLGEAMEANAGRRARLDGGGARSRLVDAAHGLQHDAHVVVRDGVLRVEQHDAQIRR